MSTTFTDDSILYKLYPYSATVGKAYVLTIKPGLYNIIRASSNIVCDCFEYAIRNVGRTSFETEKTLIEKSTGRIFVKLVDRLVLFDVKRKEIIQLEKLENELMIRDITLTASTINIKPTSSVPTTFTATCVVRPEQVDHNNHLASPWYVVMAVGVINEANTKNLFKQPDYDFTFTGLRVIQLEVVHQGAALLGDELLFTVWWDVDVIKIQVTKNTATNIAYLAISLDKNTKSYL